MVILSIFISVCALTRTRFAHTYAMRLHSTHMIAAGHTNSVLWYKMEHGHVWKDLICKFRPVNFYVAIDYQKLTAAQGKAKMRKERAQVQCVGLLFVVGWHQHNRHYYAVCVRRFFLCSFACSLYSFACIIRTNSSNLVIPRSVQFWRESWKFILDMSLSIFVVSITAHICIAFGLVFVLTEKTKTIEKEYWNMCSMPSAEPKQWRSAERATTTAIVSNQ